MQSSVDARIYEYGLYEPNLVLVMENVATWFDLQAVNH